MQQIPAEGLAELNRQLDGKIAVIKAFQGSESGAVLEAEV